MAASSWKCPCGELVQATVDEVMHGRVRCPGCGLVVLPGHDDDRSGSSLEETQMINLEDMESMAQKGVDVSVSGEWDTSLADPDGKRKI
jgi:hypothetical protein